MIFASAAEVTYLHSRKGVFSFKFFFSLFKLFHCSKLLNI